MHKREAAETLEEQKRQAASALEEQKREAANALAEQRLQAKHALDELEKEAAVEVDALRAQIDAAAARSEEEESSRAAQELLEIAAVRQRLEQALERKTKEAGSLMDRATKAEATAKMLQSRLDAMGAKSSVRSARDQAAETMAAGLAVTNVQSEAELDKLELWQRASRGRSTNPTLPSACSHAATRSARPPRAAPRRIEPGFSA